MDAHYYGTDDILAAAEAVLPKLTRADVNKAIRKYLNFANAFVAVVKPADWQAVLERWYADDRPGVEPISPGDGYYA